MPDAAGNRGGGKAAWGMVALVAAIAPAAFSAAEGTFSGGVVSGSVEVGAGYDTSILGDSTGIGDAVYSAELSAGWRGIPADSLRASGGINLSHAGYLGYGEENFEQGSLFFNMEGNLPFDLSAGLGLAGRAYIRPEYGEMTSIAGRVTPSVGWRPRDGSLLAVECAPGHAAYPDFDLDNRQFALGVRVIQELGLDGDLEASWSRGTADFTARDVYADAVRTSSGVSRRDRDTGLNAQVRWEWDGVEISAGYDLYRLKSNGNLVDWGPGQTEDSNTVFTDDRLVWDFYSHTDRGPRARVNVTVSDGVRVSVAGRARRVEFDGRIAKGADDILDPAGALRRDSRYELELGVDVVRFSPALRFSWVREMSASNHYLFDFTRDCFGLKANSSF